MKIDQIALEQTYWRCQMNEKLDKLYEEYHGEFFRPYFSASLNKHARDEKI